jgi:hypothetical protein
VAVTSEPTIRKHPPSLSTDARRSVESRGAGVIVVERSNRVRVAWQRLTAGWAVPPARTWRDPAKTAELLTKPERIGVQLSEAFQLHPEQSTDASAVHHPQASYINVGGRP